MASRSHGVDPASLMRCRVGRWIIAATVLLAACGSNDDGEPTSPPSPEEPAPPPDGPAPVLVAQVPIPPNYGIHDTFVRDGIAFVCAWNTGLILYDVGNGIRGGSPEQPVEISRIVTDDAGLPGGPQVHNAWWFHNPNTGERRYVFVGQEGAGTIGSTSSGDIHVVDVSDLEHPVEVAFFHIEGAGTHNFWMDEAAEILYAAYYNAGVVALDVSGALAGDLASREIARIRPGDGDGTYTWGVQLHEGSLYAADMLSGLHQLRLEGGAFTHLAGGGNVPDRFTSDLWVHGAHAYTGTWGLRGKSAVGNVVNVWRLSASGAPARAGTVTIDQVGTISDLEVSADGELLLVTTESGSESGLYVYGLDNPAQPILRGRYRVADATQGLHTGTFATIDGRRYVFAARDPGNPALMIFDVTDLAAVGS